MKPIPMIIGLALGLVAAYEAFNVYPSLSKGGAPYSAEIATAIDIAFFLSLLLICYGLIMGTSKASKSTYGIG